MVAFSHVLTVLAATVALASPAPVSHAAGFSLEARAGQMYICKAGNKNDGVQYGVVSYDRAVGYFRDAKTNTGASGYPKPFDNRGNVMKFASGCKTDVWELPLLASGKPYDYKKKKGDDNKPGPIRVYYTKNLKFCAIGAKEKPDGTGNPHNCQLKK